MSMGKGTLLGKEIAFFEREQEMLLREYPNRYLVIYGDALEGDFGEYKNALKFSFDKHGEEPVLIRRPGDKTQTIVAPALVLGLL